MKFIYILILFNLQPIKNHKCVLIILEKEIVIGHSLEDVYFLCNRVQRFQRDNRLY